ncbi:MAG TPA: RluA family pseudouridine synthase, partial [Prosthecobacter sp.]|nr:RluA family pseudouridine synthase [Prosthecobacter sp.]
HVWQLEGGILKYFEEAGGAHYDGECFVFDQRVGVDPSLHETESTQCFVCQSPLSEADQRDSRYESGVSCPYCFKTSEDRRLENIAAREARIRQITTPLPGSVPYDNYRPLSVPAGCDGMRLIDFLMAILPHTRRSDWLGLCEKRELLTLDKHPASADQTVRAGERFLHLLPATVEPPVSPDIRILHEDEALLVLNKPAPLPMHPGGRFNRNTLQFILNAAYHPQKPRAAHRLDANTTGLVLVARTQHFAKSLQPQFARGEVEKLYLARVQGHPRADSFIAESAISSLPQTLGSREIDEDNGRPSRTEFQVLRRDADGAALLKVRPITGRTNQIRLHLWDLGFPICGDPVYLPGRTLGDTQTLTVGGSPLCLHAHRLTFTHPLTKQRMTVEAELPDWAI